jgi:hypothetical protein
MGASMTSGGTGKQSGSMKPMKASTKGARSLAAWRSIQS